ncbi:MAG TPA: glycosyltransferase family 4 protein [Chloroflexota bacterium]|nr:glycosyltransferase family 4 protein [Chloroflexota bacterium]
MRIVIVTHYWEPHVGGIEVIAAEHAQRLVRRGHEVTVVTSRLTGDPAFEESDGIRIHRIRALNPFERHGIPFPLFSWRLLPMVAELIRTSDVVLAHSHAFLGSVAAVLAAKRYGRPSVLLQHNPFVQFRFPWNVLELTDDYLVGRRVVRAATILAAVSKHTRDHLSRLAGDRPIHVLYNGVDTLRFRPPGNVTERLEIRRRFGIPESAFIALTIRRLVFRNGVATLVKAASRLPQSPDTRVVIGGVGPEEAHLRRLIETERIGNVQLIGSISDADLADYYRAADAFVLPTLTGEGFSNSLMEALASGLPIIATRVGSPEEVVEPGENGMLIHPNDEQAMADAIVALRDEPARARVMSTRARATAERFNWETRVDSLEGLLRQACDGGAGARPLWHPGLPATRPAAMAGRLDADVSRS